jgi:hypothetical protein
MSATRRAASETNILAMLDRQASAALPQRLLRSARALPAMFWYSAAGVLVCGMVATLAWLARDSGASTAVDTALAGSIAPAGQRAAEVAAVLPAAADPAHVTADVTAHVPVAAQAPVTASLADPAPAPSPDPAPKTGATIVNVAPAAPASPAELAVQPPAAVVHRSPAPAAALPQRQQSGRITPRELQRDPQRLAARSITARTAPPRAPAQGKTAAGGTRPAALAHAAAANSSHSRRHPAPAKAATPTVDTDVALISAIIQHAATRQETEEAACADRACGPRMPAKP